MTAGLIRTHLISQSLVSNNLTSGWVCLEGGLSDRYSGPQVAVLDTVGFPPQASHGNAGPIRPGVQVLVRGEANAYAATKSKAEAIWNALHRQTVTGLLAVEGVNNPIWLGYTVDDNRPQWSLNFTTVKQ